MMLFDWVNVWKKLTYDTQIELDRVRILINKSKRFSSTLEPVETNLQVSGNRILFARDQKLGRIESSSLSTRSRATSGRRCLGTIDDDQRDTPFVLWRWIRVEWTRERGRYRRVDDKCAVELLRWACGVFGRVLNVHGHRERCVWTGWV